MTKGAAWFLGACVLVLAAWLGINATDEALSKEARAALNVPPLPAPDRDNGFLDFLVLRAPAEVPTYEAALDRLRALNGQSGGPPAAEPWGPFQADRRLRCTFGGADGQSGEARACFDLATREPWIPAALEARDTLVKRYRAMREKPRFASLIEGKSPDDLLPAYQEVLEAQRVVLLESARRFRAGDRAGAAGELQRDAAFFRRMAADANMLIDKMIAFAALDRVALFAAELARRAPRGDAVFWRALEPALSPLTKAELDVVPSLRRDLANVVGWMQTRRYVRLSDATWEVLAWSGKTRPWWDPVAPYLYRPHQTVNRHAARCGIFLAVAERPSSEFFRAEEEARERAGSLDPGPITRLILNPAGWDHPILEGCDNAAYIARAHGRAAIQTLVRLQVNLRAKGMVKPEDVAAALAGALGQAHADPFTGKPMHYEPSTQTIGFFAQATHLSGVARSLHDRYGRMALPL